MTDYDAPLTPADLTLGLAVVNQDRTSGGSIDTLEPGGFEVTWHDRGPIFYSNSDATYLRAARTAFHVDETMATEGGYIPALVTECTPGYVPLSGAVEGGRPWVWGPTIDIARKAARDANGERGLTAEAAREVVLSSFRASTR